MRQVLQGCLSGCCYQEQGRPDQVVTLLGDRQSLQSCVQVFGCLCFSEVGSLLVEESVASSCNIKYDLGSWKETKKKIPLPFLSDLSICTQSCWLIPRENSPFQVVSIDSGSCQSYTYRWDLDCHFFLTTSNGGKPPICHVFIMSATLESL